eukprot:1574454-Rhodomonas_salina.1
MVTGRALDLPDSMKRLRLDPTFSADRLRKHTGKARDPDLREAGPQAPPAPAFYDDKGNPAYDIELIVGEKPCRYKGKQTVKYFKLVKYIGPAKS